MKTLEQQIQQAFSSIELPEEVRSQTLSAIEAARNEEERELEDKAMGILNSKPRTPRLLRPAFKRAVAAVICLALVGASFGGYKAYATPTTYVAIDANPSIELSVNQFGYVVNSIALTEDAQEILDELSLNNQLYSDALAALMANERFQEYATDASYVEVNVVSDDDIQAQTVKETTSEQLQCLPCESKTVVTHNEEREAAQAAGMSVGRYRTAQALIQVDTSFSLEDCKDLSMKQLRSLLADRVSADELNSLSGSSCSEGACAQGEGKEDACTDTDNSTSASKGQRQQRGLERTS